MAHVLIVNAIPSIYCCFRIMQIRPTCFIINNKLSECRNDIAQKCSANQTHKLKYPWIELWRTFTCSSDSASSFFVAHTSVLLFFCDKFHSCCTHPVFKMYCFDFISTIVFVIVGGFACKSKSCNIKRNYPWAQMVRMKSIRFVLDAVYWVPILVCLLAFTFYTQMLIVVVQG